MIVISNSLVLSQPQTYQPNNPVIGWHNLVTSTNVSSLSAASGFPITNVANPITSPAARWQGENATGETINIQVDSVEEIDYVGIARHNLGSAAIPIIINGSIDGGSTYFELVQETLLPNDAPVIFRFEPQALTDVQIDMDGGTEAPEIAVIYVGKLLILQRRIYVPHTPINYGRSENIVNGKSESGEFLGRIITSEQRSTVVNIQNITPSWYRSDLDPFIEDSKDNPFFFAWRPSDYPYEVGFAWMINNPQPRNQRGNGMMQIDLEMTGIAP